MGRISVIESQDYFSASLIFLLAVETDRVAKKLFASTLFLWNISLKKFEMFEFAWKMWYRLSLKKNQASHI